MYPWTSGLANVDNLALLGAARAWDICLDYRYGNTVNSVKTDRRLGCVDVGQGVRVYIDISQSFFSIAKCGLFIGIVKSEFRHLLPASWHVVSCIQ